MENMILGFLNENWFTILNTIVGIIIGIVVSYYFYKKGLVKNELAYKEKSIKILDIENEVRIPNIKILYDNSEVRRLNKTYIVLWNNGNKMIEYKDIVEKDKLKINFNSNNGKILEGKVVKTVRDVNDFKVINIKDNELEIIFDFIDKEDGVLIEVFHTFYNYNVLINGTIKSMPEGIQKHGNEDIEFIWEEKRKSIISTLKFYFILMTIAGIYSSIVKHDNIIVIIVMTILFPIPGLLILKFLFKPKFPKELNMYKE